MAFIKGSVGIGGNNAPEDVRVIQWLLIRASKSADFMGLMSAKLIKENGVMDFATQIAIKEFTSHINQTLTFLTLGMSSFSSRIILPDDIYYQWLLITVVQGKCFFAQIDAENDPRIKQARDGRIAFWQFKHLVETTQCKVLTDKGVEYQTLLKEPKVKAFLDVIAWAEGTDVEVGDGLQMGYDVMYGGTLKKPKLMPDLYQHPGKVASGRYQAVPGTWEEAKKILGLFDMTPESQDIFAVYAIKKKRPKLIDFLLNDNFPEAVEEGSLEWASFPNRAASKNDVENNPTSYYVYTSGPRKGQKQPAHKLSEITRNYKNALTQYENGNK